MMAFLMMVLHHLLAYKGHYGVDDMEYASLANDLLNGQLDFENHYSYRFPIIFLTALSYQVFGINDFASALPSLFIGFLILGIVYKVLKGKGLKALLLGLFMTSLSPWILFYSDKLMPDIYVALSVLASLYAVWKIKYESSYKLKYSILLAFALLFGFMSKGTIVLILPLLLYYLVSDLIHKRNFKFWRGSIAIGILLLILYFLAIGWWTGDVFKRFEAISNNSYLNPCSYSEQPIIYLLRRISYQFWELTLKEGILMPYVFILVYMMTRNKKALFKMEYKEDFWVISAFVLLLSSNFMSISLSSYSPLCLDVRHYLFLLPVSIIAVGKVYENLFLSKINFILFMIFMLIISLLGWNEAGQPSFYIYLPVYFAVFIGVMIGRNNLLKWIGFAFLIIALFIKPIDLYNRTEKLGFREKQAEILRIVHEEDAVFITNNVQRRFLHYYLEYDSVKVSKVLEYSDSIPEDDRYIIINEGYSAYLSELAYSELPAYAKAPFKGRVNLFGLEGFKVQVFDITDRYLKDQDWTLILDETLDYDDNISECFDIKEKEILSNNKTYKGTVSEKIGQFSSKFFYELDSVLKNRESVRVLVNVKCRMEEDSDSKMAICVLNGRIAEFYKDRRLMKDLNAYGNWFDSEFEVEVPTSSILRNSKLIVYVWNHFEEEVYIDDLNIKLFIPSRE